MIALQQVTVKTTADSCRTIIYHTLISSNVQAISIPFINKYFDKIGVSPDYYREHLNETRKRVGLRNRAQGLWKVVVGVALLLAGVAQCFLPVIWIWGVGLCLFLGIAMIVYGGIPLVTGGE